MRWLKRDFLIKLSVIVVILCTIVVSMNLVELLDRYISVSLTADSYSDYDYESMKELTYARPLNSDKGVIYNEEEVQDYEQIEADIDQLLNTLPEFKGNVDFPSIFMKLDSGKDVCCHVLISFGEKLPFIIDTEGYAEKGVYIGNAHDGYWKDGKVILGGAEYDVAGVISSNYLQLDNEIYIPYELIPENGKKEFYGNLKTYIFHSGYMPVHFSSNEPGVIEHDMELMDKWNLENGIFTMTDISANEAGYIEDEKRDIPLLYTFIKRFICCVSAFFCVIAVGETIRLFISKKRTDIMILWALGSPETLILKMLIKELGPAILTGTALSFISEWIIYGLIMKCRLESVFLYGLYSLAAVMIMTVIITAVMLAITLRRTVISVIKSGE